MTENRGKLLLVVDNTYAANLANELAVLQQDLVGDGWTVFRHDVGRNDSVPSVKSLDRLPIQRRPGERQNASSSSAMCPCPTPATSCPTAMCRTTRAPGPAMASTAT